MCDESRKIVAWLDGELAAAEAEAVQRHVQVCAKCRQESQQFRRIGDGLAQEFDAYCNAEMAFKRAACGVPRGDRAIRLPYGLSSAAAIVSLGAFVAIIVVLFVLIPRAPTQLRVKIPAVSAIVPRAVSVAAATMQSSAAVSAIPVHARAKKIPPRALTQPKQVQEDASWSPGEPAIRIAIPADEVFPPGAVPEGFSFAADISIAADGSAQQLRLRP